MGEIRKLFKSSISWLCNIEEKREKKKKKKKLEEALGRGPEFFPFVLLLNQGFYLGPI